MEGYEDYSNDKDVLSKFGRNITTEVKNNKIDPVIGRDDEIRKIITIYFSKRLIQKMMLLINIQYSLLILITN